MRKKEKRDEMKIGVSGKISWNKKTWRGGHVIRAPQRK